MPRLPNQRYLKLVKKIEQGNEASIELDELFQKHLKENYDDNHLSIAGSTTFDPGDLPSSFELALEHFTK